MRDPNVWVVLINREPCWVGLVDAPSPGDYLATPYVPAAVAVEQAQEIQRLRAIIDPCGRCGVLDRPAASTSCQHCGGTGRVESLGGATTFPCRCQQASASTSKEQSGNG